MTLERRIPAIARVYIVASAALAVGCTADPEPPTSRLLEAVADVRLPPHRERVDPSLATNVSGRLLEVTGGKRAFRNWRCTIARVVDLDETLLLTCGLAGKKTRIIVRDSSLRAKSPAGRALRGAERGRVVSLSGEISAPPQGVPMWAQVTVENCGLDLRVPAENALYLEVDVAKAE